MPLHGEAHVLAGGQAGLPVRHLHCPDRHLQNTSVRHGVARVQSEIEQTILELSPVGQHMAAAILGAHDQLDSLAEHSREQRPHVVEDLACFE